MSLWSLRWVAWTSHNVSDVHPDCVLCEQVSGFYGRIVLYGVDKPRFVERGPGPSASLEAFSGVCNQGASTQQQPRPRRSMGPCLWFSDARGNSHVY